MEYTHFVSVAGLVLNDDGKILLLKSPRRGWEYPGGMVEPHETLQEALLREVREETGVCVEIVGFAGICKNVERDIVNIDFICRYVSGDLCTSDESLEVRWVKREDVSELVTFPLTIKRINGMLDGTDRMYCFAFQREPFHVVSEDLLKIKEGMPSTK